MSNVSRKNEIGSSRRDQQVLLTAESFEYANYQIRKWQIKSVANSNTWVPEIASNGNISALESTSKTSKKWPCFTLLVSDPI